MTFPSKRLGAAALAGLLAVSAGGAFAQSAKAPVAAPPAAAGAQGPLKVDLLPTQGDWMKVCGKDQANNKEVCYTTRDFGQGADQPPVLALAIYDVKGDEKRMLRLLLPVALMLKPGFRFSMDSGQPLSGAFAICFPNGCFAESELNGAATNTMKKATTLNVYVKNQVGNEVTFTLPMAGFGKAFDGQAVDPKVLEEQQKQAQRQLEERAKLERQKLEGQLGANPGAAPAAAAAPK